MTGMGWDGSGSNVELQQVTFPRRCGLVPGWHETGYILLGFGGNYTGSSVFSVTISYLKIQLSDVNCLKFHFLHE